jgi:RNA polymerase sigma-70 factor (ECF subfamily)
VLSPATKESASKGPAPLAIAGERLATVVEQHADFVWRSLRRLGVTQSQADDATQEVFIVAAQKLERIELGRERAFLYGVAMNVAAHARRARARSREVAGEEETLAAPDKAPDPEMRLADAQARAQLDRVLDALSEELRAVFVLFELEELTMIDIARLLDMPAGTVASRLRRAREEFHAAATRLRAETTRTGGRP